jgi:predicted lipoprotein with Yx(FWY)xxD motif
LRRTGPVHRSVRSTSRGVASEGHWRLLRFFGGALLVTTGAIHLDLYLTGYRTIPTIGWLFLIQVITSFVLAIAVSIARSRFTCAASAGFLVATLFGYLLSLRIGLFGFREIRTTAGTVAGVIEIVGFAAFAAFALRPLQPRQSRSQPKAHRLNVNARVALISSRWVAAVLTVQAVFALSLALPNSRAVSPSSGGSTVTLKVADIHGVSVLTNVHGYTLYWFAPDSATASRCGGTCAAYWPPMIGTPSAPGVTGTLATVRRSSGALQVTYDGHPLYTYVGDSAPGQANGNRINLNGGWWYEMKVSK